MQIVSTVKKPVRTLEDLKGQKLRTAGRPADILRNVGGTPVAVEMADIYDGLQRGVVDGLIASMEVQKGWKTGEIIDRRHMLSGCIAKERILAIPFTRGSSTTTAVLLEAIRAGTAPAAIITTDTDFFFALASVVADELYATPLPLVALTGEDFLQLRTDDDIQITKDGRVSVKR